jgi:hypothetical protein
MNSGIECRLEKYEYHKSDEVFKFIKEYFGSERKKNIKAYENIIYSPQIIENNETIFCYVAYSKDRKLPIGFLCCEKLNGNSCGRYANLIRRYEEGLPEYIEVLLMNKLQQAKIKYLNIGGAETIDLQKYKRKLAPIEERYMFMMIFNK